jgi:hypothetical protein
VPYTWNRRGRTFAAGQAQEFGDHLVLARDVGLAVGFQQGGELPLERGVAGGVAGVGPQEVAKVDVVAMRRAFRDDQVEMVVGGVLGRPERLPAFDAEIPLMLPSGSAERLDRRTDGGLVVDDNVQVDDRLGGQAGDRGAAHVLDYVRDADQRRVETVTQPLEHFRPPRVVLGDNRRNLHA